MLDEPQHRVRNHVVVLLVDVGVHLHETPAGVHSKPRDAHLTAAFLLYPGVSALDGGGDPHGGRHVDEP